jgi:hypothetical protein
MDFGVSALIALNNMLFAFLIWALPRSAVVLAVAGAFLLLYMPSLLRPGLRGCACFVHPGGRYSRGVAVAKAYLAAGAVAGALLAVVVVVTAVPEIAREAGVSVEEARILYRSLWVLASAVAF